MSEKETEGRIQQDIVKWFRNGFCTKLHSPRCKIFSIPNERNNVREQMTMIATGLEKGASDLIVVIPNRVIFVEVKTPIGAQQKEQIDFQKTVEALGFTYLLVRSLEQFQGEILEALEQKNRI